MKRISMIDRLCIILTNYWESRDIPRLSMRVNFTFRIDDVILTLDISWRKKARINFDSSFI